MRSDRAVFVAVASTTLFLFSVAANANFVDDFLRSYGFCSFEGSHYGNGSAFQIDENAPFGKPARDWTDSDLAHLHDAFQACHALTLQSGRRHEPMNYQALEATIPKIVAQARVDLRQQAEDRVAAERQRQLKQEQKAAATHDERVKAEADEKLAEDDRAASQKLAEATIARDQALIAAAHARRDAAIARQKSAAIEAEAKLAQAEAASAESSKPDSSTKFPENKAAPPIDDKKQANDAEYREVSVTDLQLAGDKMDGEKVIVRGFVHVFADQGATIYRHEDDMNGIDLNLSSGSEATRRYIVEHCGRLSRTCRMMIKATVSLNDSGKAELDLE